jgi:hypothetical protein
MRYRRRAGAPAGAAESALPLLEKAVALSPQGRSSITISALHGRYSDSMREALSSLAEAVKLAPNEAWIR